MEKRTVTIHLEADAAEWLDKQPNKAALLREMIQERRMKDEAIKP